MALRFSTTDWKHTFLCSLSWSREEAVRGERKPLEVLLFSRFSWLHFDLWERKPFQCWLRKKAIEVSHFPTLTMGARLVWLKKEASNVWGLFIGSLSYFGVLFIVAHLYWNGTHLLLVSHFPNCVSYWWLTQPSLQTCSCSKCLLSQLSLM